GLCLWLLGAPADAHGFGWRRPWSASYYAPAYYAPAYRLSYYPAVYWPQPAYQYACPTTMPAIYYPAAPLSPYAQPRPAPPSGTPEPPLQNPLQRSPKITESRYASREGEVAKEPPAAPKEYCKVGFWNLTGKDVTLLVDGKSHSLRRNHAVTLDLSRQ